MQGQHHEFIAGLPKAELHLHVEGTLTPARKFAIAKRNGITLPYADEAAIAAAQDFGGADAPAYMREFLAFYYEGLQILRTEEDFRDIAFDYLKSCKEDNVRYAEISFDPQPHTSRGIAFGAVIEGLRAGILEGAAAFGVEAQLIMCINRERSVESAMAMLDDAAPYRDWIVGLGLDSVEEGNPPVKFKDVYARARAQGMRLTAHCDVDQKDSVRHIWQCLEVLQAERIDHGINCIEDERLVDTLRERGTCLTACPTWRPRDAQPRRVDRMRTMFDKGLRVTVNTDDPGLFSSRTLATMLPPVALTGHFSREELARLMTNAFEGAWLPAERKARYVAEVRNYCALLGATQV
jgi:adenosine deaminase